MKFAHLADCHLGSWRVPELQKLNLESFQRAIQICIQEKVDFVLIAGDLFDTAYPNIDILESTFTEFKKLHDAGIHCYLCPGSHDYSVSGKTFLNVLEKIGYCTNIANFDEKDGKIILKPTLIKDIAFYGYPGKKSGLEIEDLKRVIIEPINNKFTILILHTALAGVEQNLPNTINIEELPKADYIAMGHLHKIWQKNNIIYPGPIFPNNFQELEELKHGTFFIVHLLDKKILPKKIDINIKEVETLSIEIDNAIEAETKIKKEIEKINIKEKILLLRIYGKLKQGKTSDIDFSSIENFCKEKGCFLILKNISKLEIENFIEPELEEKENIFDFERHIIEKCTNKDKTKFDCLIENILSSLDTEIKEGETILNFESRLYNTFKKIIK